MTVLSVSSKSFLLFLHRAERLSAIGSPPPRRGDPVPHRSSAAAHCHRLKSFAQLAAEFEQAVALEPGCGP
jgi:hypothetical protein